jgi:hypothetical protein
MYKVVNLPLTLPIPFGIDDTAKGTVSKATMNTLDTTVWMELSGPNTSLPMTRPKPMNSSAAPLMALARSAIASSYPASSWVNPGDTFQCARYLPSATMKRTRQNLPSTH